MKQLVRGLISILGYLLYTFGVVVVLLWLLFPADSVLVWLQGKLNTAFPSLSWNIDKLEAGFPLKLKLSDIRVNGKNEQGNQLFYIPEMHFSPDMEELVKMKKQIPIHYQMKTLDGTVAGEIVPGKGSMVKCSGELQNIQIGKLDEIWKKTNRNGSGKISGTFQYSGTWQNPLQGNLHADLKVSDGKISLQQQIFGLDQVNFNSMTTILSIKDKSVTFEDGTVDSRFFKVSYSGT
ncbi:MAG: type II secretion system protein GspN, partial [Desulfobulbaceae bacterium]|nr:type II secretion system protein GspN [Desulfobulbaceae bacterium]